MTLHEDVAVRCACVLRLGGEPDGGFAGTVSDEKGSSSEEVGESGYGGGGAVGIFLVVEEESFLDEVRIADVARIVALEIPVGPCEKQVGAESGKEEV